ncbi:MAG: glycerol-3-phosphate acyltransferase, partial [Lachnospiraceae bacterium]|nr:glycerol-3-phosphate acyltransferase [Lachnospiraceae bacterium]
MDLLLKIVLCLVVGYLFGNLSTAWFVGKIKKVDLRKCGSGNLGTTNVMRTLGKKWGIITYIGDFLKVALPVIVVKYFLYLVVCLILAKANLGSLSPFLFAFYFAGLYVGVEEKLLSFFTLASFVLVAPSLENLFIAITVVAVGMICFYIH